MPKRDGMRVSLLPGDLMVGNYAKECVLFGLFQTLNKTNDIERDGQAVFTIGPREWAKFMPITKRSVQTMRRWLKMLERMGWASVERITKDTHRVTIYGNQGDRGKHNATTNKKPLPTQSHPSQ